MFADTKKVIRRRKTQKDDKTKRTKIHRMIYKALHRKLRIKLLEPR